jgi:hypothetical protein
LHPSSYILKKFPSEFDSLEGFFSLYCFLKRPSEIPLDHKLMLFRKGKGCKPMWEVNLSKNFFKKKIINIINIEL